MTQGVHHIGHGDPAEHGLLRGSARHAQANRLRETDGDCATLAKDRSAGLHHAFIVVADDYEQAKAFFEKKSLLFEESRQDGAGLRFRGPGGNALIDLASYKGDAEDWPGSPRSPPCVERGETSGHNPARRRIQGNER